MEPASDRTQHDQHHEHGQVNIIVNGRKKSVTERELTFEQIVLIAYNDHPPTGPNLVFTVTYRKGEDHKPAGSLLPGQSVKVKDGMIFDVTVTDKS